MPVTAMGGHVALMHMSSWYYDDGRGNAVGPFDDDQLRDLVRQGGVTMASHVHRAGTTEWVPLSSVAAELGLAATAPPRPVPPPPPGAYSSFPGAPPPPPPGFGMTGTANYAGAPGLSPTGRPLASWGSRVGAWIIDALIVLVPLNIVLVAVDQRAFRFDRIQRTTGNDKFEFHFGTGGFVISLLVGILYYGLQHGMSGQTVGKRVASIRVVDANTGGVIGVGRGVWRYLFGYLLTLLCAVPGVLDVLWPLWDKRRQALHDKVVNSVVERTR
jgi:uncharacterized RDD family membrane protein YckC